MNSNCVNGIAASHENATNFGCHFSLTQNRKLRRICPKFETIHLSGHKLSWIVYSQRFLGRTSWAQYSSTSWLQWLKASVKRSLPFRATIVWVDADLLKTLVILMDRNGAKNAKIERINHANHADRVVSRHFTICSPLFFKALNSPVTSLRALLASPVASRHESMRFVSMMKLYADQKSLPFLLVPVCEVVVLMDACDSQERRQSSFSPSRFF